jgi:hypothetical protein
MRSLRDKPQSRDVVLYVFDIGLNETQRRWLSNQGITLHVPQDSLLSRPLLVNGSAVSAPPVLHAFLSRSRIPELFPGHDVYLWIDADAWVQRWEGVEAYVEGAMRSGFAVTPETDPAYTIETYLDGCKRAGRVPNFHIDPAYSRNTPVNISINRPSFAMFGDEYLTRLCLRPTSMFPLVGGRLDRWS